MKKNDLIKALEELPDDAEIFVVHGDDILGEYHFSSPYIMEDVAYEDKRGGLYTSYSNYRGDKKKTVWSLT